LASRFFVFCAAGIPVLTRDKGAKPTEDTLKRDWRGRGSIGAPQAALAFQSQLAASYRKQI
jgi:hypothetical protein